MKGQTSVEFMFMVMFASAMLVIFAYIFGVLYQDNLKDKQKILFSDLGESLKQEIIAASGARPGYQREFVVPEYLEGYPYTISLSDSTLTLISDYASLAILVPAVSGNLLKGQNTIKNINNSICINC